MTIFVPLRIRAKNRLSKSLCIFIYLLFSLSSSVSLSQEGSFPTCENLFVSLDEMWVSSPINTDAIKSTLFKIANEKRIEMARFVRDEKNQFFKRKEQVLKEFDAETKKNSLLDDQRLQRSKERSELIKKWNGDKTTIYKALDEQQKSCQIVLAEKREYYLNKIREMQIENNHSKKTKDSDLDEFRLIPKGPGTVLKPQ